MKEQVGDAYQRVAVYYFKLSSMVQQRLTARQRVRHADQAMVALNHKIFEVAQELNSLEEDLMQVRVKIAADDDANSETGKRLAVSETAIVAAVDMRNSQLETYPANRLAIPVEYPLEPRSYDNGRRRSLR